MHKVLSSVDDVPCTMPEPLGIAKLEIFEDNDAVIKMRNKGRTNSLRYTPRTVRIDLDWIFHMIRIAPGLAIENINTKQQIVDIFTKGLFIEKTRPVYFETPSCLARGLPYLLCGFALST